MNTLAIIGAAGRMGRRLSALAIEGEVFDLAAALEQVGHEDLGKDIGELAGMGPFGLAVADALSDHPDVAVDFSLPEGTMHWLPVLRKKGVPLILGTTGLTESQLAELADSASDIPVVHASNYSVGMTVLFELVGQVAGALGPDYDIDIAETHHRFKADAPSGTALTLAKNICAARNVEPGETLVYGRGGREPRQSGEIGMHALRLGDTVGEHSVHFGCLGETVTLSHSAHTRDTFARGALRAAEWVVGKKPGLYDMTDVLGL
jgi:4-hydroxy-tetrahydrodipicolinate reductase